MIGKMRRRPYQHWLIILIFCRKYQEFTQLRALQGLIMKGCTRFSIICRSTHKLMRIVLRRTSHQALIKICKGWPSLMDVNTRCPHPQSLPFWITSTMRWVIISHLTSMGWLSRMIMSLWSLWSHNANLILFSWGRSEKEIILFTQWMVMQVSMSNQT